MNVVEFVTPAGSRLVGFLASFLQRTKFSPLVKFGVRWNFRGRNADELKNQTRFFTSSEIEARLARLARWL